MRSWKSLLMVVVALILVSCSMSAKPEKNETEKVSSAQGEVIVLNKADFLSKVYNYEKNQTQWVYEGNKPAIIDFYADWCGPCKKVSPILKELAAQYKDDIVIYKINVDNEKELVCSLHIPIESDSFRNYILLTESPPYSIQSLPPVQTPLPFHFFPVLRTWSN